MSRAGKFIPGGAKGDGTPAQRTGPIRAPQPGAPAEATGGKKTPTPAKGSSLIRPVAKNQKLPIAIMSGFVCFILVSAGWYFLSVVPGQRAQASIQAQLDAAQKQIHDNEEAQKKKDEEAAAAAATARATLTVDSKPAGATVTIGDLQKTAPAKFDTLIPGTVTVVVHLDGYEDVKQDVTVVADKPLEMGTITLAAKSGDLALSSPQENVQYTLTNANGFSRQGELPAKLEKLSPGEYQLTTSMDDWKLPTETITIKDKDKLQKEIKFPYGTVAISSTPPGATVRNGKTIVGKTPLNLPDVRPGVLQLSVDLPPYLTQVLSVKVPDFGNITKQVALKQDKDFIAAIGMPMVWIPDGNFWAAKYDMPQAEFETVAAYNPSFFRRPNRPVEQINWENAMAFCEKLTQYERKAGKLPNGYHYTLPTESQWSLYSADADVNQAAMSRTTTLSSTVDVGASEPNKYGIYDSLGNVWEWCADSDDKGNHSVRGGSWLSSPSNFPNADTRQVASPKYSDKFTGFRVVLVPQS